MKHKLIVTIPSYKQPEQLSRALYALTLQTFKDFSVVIIDDNSNVDIASIIKPYQDSLSILVIVNKRNFGAMENMLNSIRFEADTDYIFSHHEDDYIKCNYLEEAVRILESTPSVSFVVSSPIWVLKDTKYQEGYLTKKDIKLLTAEDFMIESLLREPFVFGSVIYRKSDIMGSFDMKTYHILCDKIFLTEILLAHGSSCGYIQEPAVYVRDHTKDEKDVRGEGATIDNLINYFNFYKKHLPRTQKITSLITNNLLLGYVNLYKRTSLFELYAKQKKYHLISLRHINIIGLYALTNLLPGGKLLLKLFQLRILKKKTVI